MDPMPARTAVAVSFHGQPDAPSLPEAVHWMMTAVAQSDNLPVHTSGPPFPTVVYFADSSWSGMPPVPCGVADAVTDVMWVAPDQPAPSGWPPRRRIRMEVPGGDPDVVTLTEAGPEWKKYMCQFKHGRFTLNVNDGSVLVGEKDSLYVVVWGNGKGSWHPWGLYVFGGVLQSQAVVLADRPTTSSHSMGVIAPLQLSIRRVLGRNPGTVAFDVTLAQPSAARLDLYDVQGRRVAWREVNGLASQKQRVSIDDKRPPAGVYWARLAQGHQKATTRVLILP